MLNFPSSPIHFAQFFGYCLFSISKWKKEISLFSLFFFSLLSESFADPIKVGVAGSLTGFAGQYGTAVLEGAKLASEEVNKDGLKVEIITEDDQSVPRNLALSYQKLSTADRIQALVTGSWWANSIVSAVQNSGIPFLSCETLYNNEYVKAPNYFSLQGDLRDWVRAFEPLIKKRGWKRAAMVRFTSGFADTIEEEMRALFSKEGRSFMKAIVYSEIELREASTVAAQIKALKPEVLYIDAQPSGFAALMTRLIEQHMDNLVVLTNPIARDAYEQKLFDPKRFSGEIFYSQRESFSPEFLKKFRMRYGREPLLNSDLGYYAVQLLVKAFNDGKSDPIERLKSGKLSVDGMEFRFDENNVFHGLEQEIWTFGDAKPIKTSN